MANETTGPDGIRDEAKPPATMSIEDAAKLLGIGRSSCYRAAHAGRIPVIIIGRRMLVVTAKLHRMLGLGYEGGVPEGTR